MIIPPNILLIEHDLRLARSVRDHLAAASSVITVVFESASISRELVEHQPDFVLADCETLPERDGARFCRALRDLTPAPLILFSGQFTPAKQARLLEAGADDCLEKPFLLQELSARIGAVWRRYLAVPPRISSARAQEDALEYPQLSISLSNYKVICGGVSVEMAPRELELLHFLAKSPNQVFSREQLLDQIWGYDYLGDVRTVDVHMKRIRDKLNRILKKDHAAWSLDTVWGVGYKFSYVSTRTSSDVRRAPSAETDSA